MRIQLDLVVFSFFVPNIEIENPNITRISIILYLNSKYDNIIIFLRGIDVIHAILQCSVYVFGPLRMDSPNKLVIPDLYAAADLV